MVYVSRRGSTARIAASLAEGIDGAEACDVADVGSLDCDLVVLGSSVRVGGIDPRMIEFLEKNRERLSGVPKALFVVCLCTFLGRRYLTRFRKYVEGEIVAYRVFGGRLGFIGRVDTDYAREAGKNIASLTDP